jgi:hypothetical protein
VERVDVLAYISSETDRHFAAGRIRSIEISGDPIVNPTRDLPACSIVPQPTTPLLFTYSYFTIYNLIQSDGSLPFT